MTDDTNIEEIRKYLELMEASINLDISSPEMLTESIVEEEPGRLSESALSDLKMLINRWTTFSLMESQSEEYSSGYEAGLQKAAEMLETIIERHYGEILSEINN